ncbi:hypothetical protein Y032_0148g2677 [Ancylostoma ceylanicum]|uniref:Uncharacterized protein n=1 Tax=Ancylostoma ceylanicum TaxID=53326 RepID=A0A016T292_9BILA|nr:hypothetical protein Y032_0148g2677 [Ancylostoma ceylanicum]
MDSWVSPKSLIDSTSVQKLIKPLEPFQIWRILPTVSDQCSVNAQISLRSYSTPGQYNIYFIQNMNTTLAASKCTVVSLENSQNAEAEERLLMENSKCRLLAIADRRAHNESERIRHLPLSVMTSRTEGIPSDGDGFVSLIRNRVGEVVDLLMIGSEKSSYDYVKLILTEINETSGVIVCQVTYSLLPEY